MRILIINELNQFGGAEIQANMEKELMLSKGHEVYFLTFDDKFPLNTEGNDLNVPIKMNTAEKVYSHIIGSPKIKKEIREIINRVQPEVVHLHNLIKIPIEILECIKDIPAVQTVHDYSAICIKSTCINKRKEECCGYNCTHCFKCIGFSPKFIYRYIFLKRYNRLRKKAVDLFVAPSKALTNKLNSNGIDAFCINNPFDISKFSCKEKMSASKKIYMYYGRIVDYKGINELFRAFDDFSKNKNVELWVVGNVDRSFEKRFDILMKADYAVYLGEKSFEDIMRLYKDIYCVVVPSLWIENYPNTVIEAVANKTLVIGTDRGGIPEIIRRKDLCFNILDEHSFVEALEYTYGLSEAEYKTITESMNERLLSENSLERYYSALMSLITNLLRSKETDLNKQVGGV